MRIVYLVGSSQRQPRREERRTKDRTALWFVYDLLPATLARQHRATKCGFSRRLSR
jgi:hypothetical protein